jgi:predicted DNA-binding transcriptional regulator AlpA
MITTEEFARLACISRRQIDRLRTKMADGFPREFEMGSGSSKHRRCPRFRLSEVQLWLESRAMW